jgi:hypothetical protein
MGQSCGAGEMELINMLDSVLAGHTPKEDKVAIVDGA